MTRDLNGSQWMQTISGQAFYMLDPLPEDFVLDDIAHALSMQCRFNGHMSEFYSVAQHSVMVMRCVRDRFGIDDRQTLRTALMHDASEAYIGDMVRPLKAEDAFFRDTEERLDRALASRFDLDLPMSPTIKRADIALCMAERRDLLAEPPRPWTIFENPWPQTLLRGWLPIGAKITFLEAADTLGLS